MPSSMRAATALLLLPAITAPALAHKHRENRPPPLPFSEDLEKSDAAVDTVAIQFETPCFGCAADEGEVGRLLFQFSADGTDATCTKSVLKLNGQDLVQEWNGEDSKGEGSLLVQLVDREDQREVAASWRSHCVNHDDREVMQVFAFTIHSVADVQVPEDFGFQIFLRQSPRLEIVNIEQLPLERDADGDDHEHHRHHGDHHHDDTKHLEKVLQHEVSELHHLEMELEHLVHHIEHKKGEIRKLEMNPRLMIDEVRECSGLHCVFATVGRKGMMIFEFLGLSSHGPPRGPPPHGWVEGEVHDGPFGPHDHGHEHGPHGFDHHGPHGEEFDHPHPHHHHEEEGMMEEHPHHHPHPWGPPPPGKWEQFGDDEFRPEHFDHHHDEDFRPHHHHEFDEEFDHHRHHEFDEEFDDRPHHHEKPEHDNGSEDKPEVKPEQHSGWDHHDHEVKPHDFDHKYKGDVKPDDKEDHHREGHHRWNPNFNSGEAHDADDKEPGPPGPPPHGPPPPDGHPPGPPPHDGPPFDGPPHGPPFDGPPHGPPPHGPPPHGPHPHHNETEHPHHPHHNETEHPHPPPPKHGDHPHPPPGGPPPGPPPGGDHPHPGPPGPPFDGPGGPHSLLPFRLSSFHFFAAFLLLLTGAGLLFKFVRSRLNPMRRALRAQMAEERRNARRARRASRMHRWSQWWNRYREPTDRADYEEKAALILEQEGLLEEAIESEMEVAMAEEARAPAAPAVVEHHIIYTPRTDSLIAPSTTSSIIMTPASSEAEPMLPSYEQELDDEIHVVDGFNYTPSSGSDTSSLYHSREVSVESGRDEKR